jgi:tripartite-type tricarboxylate transporter receptor subunit TctC
MGGRAVAEGMEKYLKQPVVVVNKPGAGTTLGGGFVAAAKPDGYTLGFLTTTTVLPELYGTYKVPYSKKDLKLISGVLDIPMAIFVKADAPWKTLKELGASGITRDEMADLERTTSLLYLCVLAKQKD